MSFAAEHASAYADILENGLLVRFVLTSPGAENDTTGAFTGGTSTTVEGAAMFVAGDPTVYESLKLIESSAPTLLVAMATYGQVIPLRADVWYFTSGAWVSTGYVVKSVAQVAPDGVMIVARVVVGR